jgi:ketosteroid isomerase-like protein
MSDAENIKVGLGYVEALSKGDMTTVGELLADDVVWHQPGVGHLSGTFRGKGEVFPHLAKFTELSNESFRVDKVGAVMANGEMVTANLHFVATRPGRNLSMDGIDLMRIEAGQIKEMWLFSGDQTAEDAFWSA